MRLPKFLNAIGSKCILTFLDKKWAFQEQIVAQFDYMIVSDVSLPVTVSFCDCNTCEILENGHISVTSQTTWIDLPDYEYGITWTAYEVV